MVDPLTREFKLRQGVKFHDGQEFTATDVKFSLERIANLPNNPNSDPYAAIRYATETYFTIPLVALHTALATGKGLRVETRKDEMTIVTAVHPE